MVKRKHGTNKRRFNNKNYIIEMLGFTGKFSVAKHL